MTSTISSSLREGVPLLVGATFWLCALPPLLNGAGAYAAGMPVALPLGVAVMHNDHLRARLAGARTPTAQEMRVLAPALTIACRAQHGPPLVRLSVQRNDQRLTTSTLGHRTVVVPSGLVNALTRGDIGAHAAAATLIHGAATVRSGRTRPRPLRSLLRAPWLVLSSMFTAVAQGWVAAPLVRTAWRLRALPGGVAATNFALSGHLVMALVTALIVGLSYAWTWANGAPLTSEPAPGDTALAALGLTSQHHRLIALERTRTPGNRHRRPWASVTG